MMLLRWVAGLVCLIGLFSPVAMAHEVRPGFLELRETAEETYAVTWKQPVSSNGRLAIDPVFPENCSRTDATGQIVEGALVERWEVTCNLKSAAISVRGLDRTLTDVFVRASWLDGRETSGLLRAGQPEISLAAATSSAAVYAYLRLGVDHILFGFDHLLFVLGIVLLVRRNQLLATATAFTAAHSITLALAALGGVTLPGPPVEITIALSIVLLAVEAVHRTRGQIALSARWPWVIAFGFGLIHGFGFAGALSNIGLPKGAEVMALLLFNFGVEVGQVAVILNLLAMGWVLTRLRLSLLAPVRLFAMYFIGIAGSFWAIERIAGSFLA